ncbi:uncharacterized protein LTR77_011044 [Saxophila tyrrhenica]|uniref:Uncharacterized protein n=1 Tax=Saxophila tyrrhenica TaxID=1690608 RepID=A0AAV9NU10_9PEZI|nr:hypothetical protein LTR77_011044 [Saxophila tyrrhenica]
MFAFLALFTTLLALTTALPSPLTFAKFGAPIHSLAAVTANCPHKLFNCPWLLTGITIYNPPAPPEAATPWVRFNFIDYNHRLRLETVCYGDLVNGTTQGGYVLCADDRVAFQLVGGPTGRTMMVERVYRDRCLGEPPYNYGTAFGQNNLSMPASLPSTAGGLQVQDQMFVTITGMA